MKVFALPSEVPAPHVDYRNFDLATVTRDEDAHKEALKKWLIAAGYTGELTGEIYSEPIADGMAQYMYADNGAKSVLIHLPYGDAYDSRDVEHVPRKVIVERIAGRKHLDALFASRR